MPIGRRSFLAGAGAGALTALSASCAQMESRPAGKAIAFDGFPIIDARPIGAKTEALFPGHGDALLNAWRTRQFEYTWLRTISDSYADFWQTTQDALVFAARSLGLPLDANTRDQLMQTYLELKAWDDVRPALETLRSAGFRLAFLSNFTARMLDAAVQNSGLQDFFEAHLTTDRVRVFKPAPLAYQMGINAFGLPRERIIFCAAAGWDAAGARSFGYRTFWLNRTRAPAEELGVKADGEGAGMNDLVRFALADASRQAFGR
jgi:2-haloacid dehalogenase